MSTATIAVTLNGELKNLPESLTVAHLLQEMKLPQERLAVEINQAIVPRAQWDSFVIQAGASVEIVQFVGGG